MSRRRLGALVASVPDASWHAACPPQTMRDLLLHGSGAFGLSGFVVIDCRYDYEFEGGRLPGGRSSC